MENRKTRPPRKPGASTGSRFATSRGRLDIGVYGARGIPSTYSGYETFLTALLPALASRGHKLTMYCRRGEIGEEGRYRGVDRVTLPAVRSKQLHTLTHGMVASLASRLKNHDVVLVVNVANAPFCALSRFTGQRVVLNTDGQEWLRGKWGTMAKLYYKWCAKSARFTAALVSDSNGMREVYVQQFRADSTVIPYCWTGIPIEPDQSALDALGVSAGRYFVVAARFNPENNLQHVVRAYIASKANLPLLVLGTANYASPVATELKRLAADHGSIILGGHIADRPNFGLVIREAAAYIHAHSVGGMNPSLVDALGVGARILALGNRFNRETVGDAGECFEDFRELAARLKAVEDEAGTSTDFAWRQRAVSRAEACFALEEVTDAYEALLLEACRRPVWESFSMQTRWQQPVSR